MKDKLKELWDKLTGKTKSEPQARQTPDQAQHNDELFRELTSADHRGGRW